jgi:hypothetical protein
MDKSEWDISFYFEAFDEQWKIMQTTGFWKSFWINQSTKPSKKV